MTLSENREWVLVVNCNSGMENWVRLAAIEAITATSNLILSTDIIRVSDEDADAILVLLGLPSYSLV